MLLNLNSMKHLKGRVQDGFGPQGRAQDGKFPWYLDRVGRISQEKVKIKE